MALAIKKGKIYFQMFTTLIIRDKALAITLWLYLYLQADDSADQVHEFHMK